MSNTSYYNPEDQLLHINVTNRERLMLELNRKQYYSDYDLCIFLEENGLDPSALFDKDQNYKKLLITVREILESLANNIDTFRSVETEFATTGAAYEHLERRIQRLQQRIDAIPDKPNENGRESIVTYLFKD